MGSCECTYETKFHISIYYFKKTTAVLVSNSCVALVFKNKELTNKISFNCIFDTSEFRTIILRVTQITVLDSHIEHSTRWAPRRPPFSPPRIQSHIFLPNYPLDPIHSIFPLPYKLPTHLWVLWGCECAPVIPYHHAIRLLVCQWLKKGENPLIHQTLLYVR